jgi:tellurite methyltransferase
VDSSHNLNDLEPASFLVENLPLLPKGRVLDVAMGAGRNAIYLARMGFDVDGVDISSEAVNSAREAAARAGVIIKAEVADLEKGYRIGSGAYDAVICFNYLQRSLVPQIKEGLRVGGVVIYETFLIEQAQWAKPKNPYFLLQHSELLRLFADLRCLRYREGIFESGDYRKAVASIVAVKENKEGS